MKSKLFILASLILLGAFARADRPSIHGMALFGDKQLFASHLPMFHAPHDYQLVFELSLQEVDTGVLEKLSNLKKTGQTFYTIEPELMDLTKIMSHEVKQFTANLYSGHFERKGKILGEVIVQVGKILLQSKLQTTGSQDNKYLVFGSNGEYFATHIIQGKPNLDHIVKVAQPFFFDIPFCNRRICPDPQQVLIDDSKLPIQLDGKKSGFNIIAPQVGESLGSGLDVNAQITEVIYSEREELSH